MAMYVINYSHCKLSEFMVSEEIRIELYRRKKTANISLIASAIGVSRQAVCNCIDHQSESVASPGWYPMPSRARWRKCSPR